HSLVSTRFPYTTLFRSLGQKSSCRRCLSDYPPATTLHSSILGDTLMTAPHILVVDDEPDIRSLIREILEDENYRVTIAENGAARSEEHTSELQSRFDLV